MRSYLLGSNYVIQCRYHFATSLFATIVSPLSFPRIDSDDEISQVSNMNMLHPEQTPALSPQPSRPPRSP